MNYQRCKLCGVRNDAFGCYERCSVDGPWHEWIDSFDDLENAIDALGRGQVIASEQTREMAKQIIDEMPIRGITQDAIVFDDAQNIGEPEFVGTIKLRQDIEIIPADPSDIKIGWVCYTYIGCEVIKDPVIRAGLYHKNDILPGDEVYVSFMDNQYRKAVVRIDGKTAETEYNLYLLEFDRDERHCWTCGNIINKKILSMDLK